MDYLRAGLAQRLAEVVRILVEDPSTRADDHERPVCALPVADTLCRKSFRRNPDADRGSTGRMLFDADVAKRILNVVHGRRVILYCPQCERPGITRRQLGFIDDDGTFGTVAGLACAACGHIAPIPGAPYIADRDRVVLIPPGLTAGEYLLARLRATGCDPKPRS